MRRNPTGEQPDLQGPVARSYRGDTWYSRVVLTCLEKMHEQT